MANIENKENADIVKSLHKTLRCQIKKGQDPVQTWNNLLDDKLSLKEYSKAMYDLANKQWLSDSTGSRIKWCLDKCDLYFYNNGLLKFSKKLYKRKLYSDFQVAADVRNETVEKINEKVENFKPSLKHIFNDKLLVLDVGSCYNPFSINKTLFVVPIDIAPATNDVMYYDFLNANFESVNHTNDITETDLTVALKDQKLFSNVFHVVIFSLLLSYFPTSKQRLQCCINAHKALQIYGVLIIVTPDSSHQNRHVDVMKSWRQALEGIGFVRWKYEKLEHLHCMAYTKVNYETKYDEMLTKYADFLYIPQDFQVEDIDNKNQGNFVAEYDAEIFCNVSLDC